MARDNHQFDDAQNPRTSGLGACVGLVALQSGLALQHFAANAFDLSTEAWKGNHHYQTQKSRHHPAPMNGLRVGANAVDS